MLLVSVTTRGGKPQFPALAQEEASAEFSQALVAALLKVIIFLFTQGIMIKIKLYAHCCCAVLFKTMRDVCYPRYFCLFSVLICSAPVRVWESPGWLVSLVFRIDSLGEAGQSSSKSLISSPHHLLQALIRVKHCHQVVVSSVILLTFERSSGLSNRLTLSLPVSALLSLVSIK